MSDTIKITNMIVSRFTDKVYTISKGERGIKLTPGLRAEVLLRIKELPNVTEFRDSNLLAELMCSITRTPFKMDFEEVYSIRSTTDHRTKHR